MAINYNRANRAGKNGCEKNRYRKFLTSNSKLGKTESDPIDTRRTDEPLCDDIDEECVGGSKRKSIQLRMKDWLTNHVLEAIVVIAISGLITFCWNTSITMALQGSQITDIKEDLKNVVSMNSENEKNISSSKEAFGAFKAEILEKIKWIENILKRN